MLHLSDFVVRCMSDNEMLLLHFLREVLIFPSYIYFEQLFHIVLLTGDFLCSLSFQQVKYSIDVINARSEKSDLRKM